MPISAKTEKLGTQTSRINLVRDDKSSPFDFIRSAYIFVKYLQDRFVCQVINKKKKDNNEFLQ
jgi:hypothetical protein